MSEQQQASMGSQQESSAQGSSGNAGLASLADLGSTTQTSQSQAQGQYGTESQIPQNTQAGATTQAAQTTAQTSTMETKQTKETATTTGDSKWFDALPDDLKMEKSLQNFKTLEDATRAFVSAQKMVGRDKITVPDLKTATADELQGVYKKLGLPEDVKDYGVELDKDSGLDPGFLEQIKLNAHKVGILPKQLETLLKWYSGESKAVMAAHNETLQKAHTEAHQKLKSDWGDAFPKNILAAKLALKDGATTEEMKYLAEKKMTEDPVLIRIFSKLGLTLKEGELKSGNGSGGGHLMPTQALDSAQKIMGDFAHPYNNPQHPNHNAAVIEVEKLMKAAHPEEPKNI